MAVDPNEEEDVETTLRNLIKPKYCTRRPRKGHSVHERSSLLWLPYKPKYGGVFLNDFDATLSYQYSLEDRKREFFKVHGYYRVPPVAIIDLISLGIKDTPYETEDDMQRFGGHVKLPVQHWSGDCPQVSRATVCRGKLMVERNRSFAPSASSISVRRLAQNQSSPIAESVLSGGLGVLGDIICMEREAAPFVRSRLGGGLQQRVRRYISACTRWVRA